MSEIALVRSGDVVVGRLHAQTHQRRRGNGLNR